MTLCSAQGRQLTRALAFQPGASRGRDGGRPRTRPPWRGPPPRPAAFPLRPARQPANWTAAARRPCAASRGPCCCRCSSLCLWSPGLLRRRSARRGAWCGVPGCRRASFCRSAISTCRPSARRAKTSLARPQVAFSRGPPLSRCRLPCVPAARPRRRDRASRESAPPLACSVALPRASSSLHHLATKRGGSRNQSLLNE